MDRATSSCRTRVDDNPSLSATVDRADTREGEGRTSGTLDVQHNIHQVESSTSCELESLSNNKGCCDGMINI